MAEIRVENLAAVQRAFKLVSVGLHKDLRAGLQSVAEPVRTDAQQIALENISGLRRSQIPWHEMKTGVTMNHVYIVPKQRGVTARARQQFRRPRFGRKLLREAMEPALARNFDRVKRELNDVVRDAVRLWGRL